MEDYLKEALEIVKAQAGVRTMTSEEITGLLQGLTRSLQGIEKGSEQADSGALVVKTKNSIKEKSITCLECGKVFKLLSKKHLATHGLDAVTYREKWGLKPKTALIAKGLQRERRKKMKDMKLWERRGPTTAQAAATEAKAVAPAKPKAVRKPKK